MNRNTIDPASVPTTLFMPGDALRYELEVERQCPVDLPSTKLLPYLHGVSMSLELVSTDYLDQFANYARRKRASGNQLGLLAIAAEFAQTEHAQALAINTTNAFDNAVASFDLADSTRPGDFPPDNLISLAGLRWIFGVGDRANLLKKAKQQIDIYLFLGRPTCRDVHAIRKTDVQHLFDWRTPKTSPVDT